MNKKQIKSIFDRDLELLDWYLENSQEIRQCKITYKKSFLWFKWEKVETDNAMLKIFIAKSLKLSEKRIRQKELIEYLVETEEDIDEIRAEYLDKKQSLYNKFYE